jgi:hypothetical protein
MNSGPRLERGIYRRTAVRYKLRLPVVFYWNDGTERVGGGFTSDVALDGALIVSQTRPPIGSTVQIEIFLPSPNQSEERFRIECTGVVTRVTGQIDESAFGVRGAFDDNHLFCHLLV